MGFGRRWARVVEDRQPAGEVAAVGWRRRKAQLVLAIAEAVADERGKARRRTDEGQPA